MLSQPRGEIVSKQRLSFLTGYTIGECDRLIAEGMPVLEQPTDKGGQYKIATAAAIQWLAGGKVTNSRRGSNLDASRARLADFQADVQELRAATMRAELLPAADVVAGWQAAMSRCRSLLLGIPTASAATIILLARSREPEEAERMVREHLVALIDHALLELANTSLEDDESEEKEQEEGEDSTKEAGSNALSRRSV